MRIYSTLSERKEDFRPIQKNRVSLYVCGITPYDTTHVGHAFTYLVFDVLVRFLAFKGMEVNYVQNVTDIDDDILKRAKEMKTGWKSLGNVWTERYLTDMRRLNVLPPTHYVKATDTIAEIIRINKKLEKSGFAYESGSNLYFRINKNENYGKLSKYPENKMIMLLKERGGDPDDRRKKAPLDFILWQKSAPGEPFWPSPWSKGRPGWHIECSAMAYKFLGPQIDIHGGGSDLIFPHHESEIAQSEAFTGKKPFVKYWMHTAMVRYRGDKMSKSLGNLVLVSDLLKKYSPNTIRYSLISHNYRKPWEFDEKQLNDAEKNVNKIQSALGRISDTEGNAETNNPLLSGFTAQLDDNLNIPDALIYMQKFSNRLLKENNSERRNNMQKALFTMWSLLGFT